jgi:exonuclease-1
MAILSGCDYLPGIGGLGLKTAHRMLRKHKTVDRLVKAAQFDGKLKVPSGFMADFDQAEKTFLYQWVFCPLAKQLVHLTPLADGLNIVDMPFLGEEVPAHIAIGVAQGDLNPRSKLPITVPGKIRPNSRPIASSRRASAHIQTPDLKGTKSIDSFFKPKRTPLAELDPNTFTPSPSQETLLQQQRNNNGWVAVPAPVSRLQHGSSVPSTAPQPARRIHSDPTGGRRSAPNPSKRQRLCSDSVPNTPSAPAEGVVRSQFFASSVPEPSPSLRPTKDCRRTGQDFELYSDDSVENAMAEAADLEEAVFQSKKKLKIFSDNSQSTSQSVSQSTVASRSTVDQSQRSFGTLTPATSFGSPEPEALFSSAISSQMSDLRSKFTYKPSGSSSSSNARVAKPGPRKLNSVSTGFPDVALESASRSTHEVTSETIVPGTPASKEFELDNSAWAAMEAEVVVAASSPPPCTPSKRRRSSLKGSEDLLVPDSEAESECSPRKPMFSLARFAFAG